MLARYLGLEAADRIGTLVVLFWWLARCHPRSVSLNRATRSLLGSVLLASIVLGLIKVGWTTVSAREPDGAAAGPSSSVVTESSSPGECTGPDIVLGRTLQSSIVDRASALKASGAIGVRGDATIALLTTVTVGTRTGSIAIPAEALVDGRGRAIVDRPAWFFVFKNQAVRMPSGGVHVPGVARSSPPVQSVLASIVDAETGQFLRGWGCAFGN